MKEIQYNGNIINVQIYGAFYQMEAGNSLLDRINQWSTESMPLSKEPIVSELGRRLVPIVEALLERITALETRLAELENGQNEQ